LRGAATGSKGRCGSRFVRYAGTGANTRFDTNSGSSFDTNSSSSLGDQAKQNSDQCKQNGAGAGKSAGHKPRLQNSNSAPGKESIGQDASEKSS
jgi:hypothetical protein